MRNKKVLLLLFPAKFISGFATGITIFALPWYVVTTFEDGSFMNSVTFGVVTFLSLFWSVYIGTVIDRFNRKRIFQVLNGVDALLLITVALATRNLEQMPFVFLALVTCSTIFTFNVHYPNLYAMMQEIFEPKHYAKVNSALEMLGQFTNFFGMLAGGLLIAGTGEIGWWPEALQFEAWTMSEIFLMDGITYGVSFVLISMIPYIPDAARMARRDGGVWDRIRLGFQYLKNDRPLLIFGISSFVVFFTLLVMVQVALPMYIAHVLQQEQAEGALTFAALEYCYCGGAIVAGILGILFSKHLNNDTLIRLIIGLALLCGAIYFVWGLTAIPLLFILSGLLLGISNAGIRILRITYIVRIIPNYMIGRVNSFFSIANVVMRFTMIGVIALPFFSGQGNGGNISYAVMIMGALALLSGIVLIGRFRSFPKHTTINPG